MLKISLNILAHLWRMTCFKCLLNFTVKELILIWYFVCTMYCAKSFVIYLISYSWPVLVICLCVTFVPKLNDLTEEAFIASQFLWVRNLGAA